MTDRAGTVRGELGALLLLAALWGGSFVFIGVAVEPLGPIPLMALRVTLAGGALVLYTAAAGARGAVRLTPGLLVLGALNAAIPFSLIAAAQRELTASTAAVLNASVPLFAVLAAAAWDRRPVGARRLAGVALGVAGVALVVGWTPGAAPLQSVSGSGTPWLAAAASLLASASYGVAGVYAARRLPGTPALTLAIGQQIGAAAILVVPALVLWPAPAWPSPAVVAAVVALALLSTAAGFVLYFHLIATAGPVTAASVTFLIPVFGVAGGNLVLGDPVGPGLLAGLAAILAGVLLVRERRPGAAPAGEAAGQPPDAAVRMRGLRKGGAAPVPPRRP